MTDEEELLKEYERLADEVDLLYRELVAFFQDKGVHPCIAALAMHDLYTVIQKDSEQDLALGDAREILDSARKLESNSEVTLAGVKLSSPSSWLPETENLPILCSPVLPSMTAACSNCFSSPSRTPVFSSNTAKLALSIGGREMKSSSFPPPDAHALSADVASKSATVGLVKFMGSSLVCCVACKINIGCFQRTGSNFFFF